MSGYGQLLVVATPQIDPENLDWIEGIRARHDPNHSIIKPHFTLVFPGHELASGEFVSHVRESVKYRSEFSFTLDRAEILDSSHDGAKYVALIPGEGFDDFLELHDRLYSGAIEQFLRKDLPFQPHMTIGRLTDRKDAARLIDELSQSDIDIHGKVTDLSILKLDSRELELIEIISLGIAL
jgi:2'-5' RNA ligase